MTFISQTIRAISTPDIVLTNVPCDPSVIVGDWVRMNDLGIAVKAKADTFENSNVIGLVEEITGTNVCSIRVLGVSKEIFTGLDTTKEYMLSAVNAGEMSTTVPTNSGEIVLKVGQPFSQTRFLVLKGMRMERA